MGKFCDGYYKICQNKGVPIADGGSEGKFCLLCLQEYYKQHPGVEIQIGKTNINLKGLK